MPPPVPVDSTVTLIPGLAHEILRDRLGERIDGRGTDNADIVGRAGASRGFGTACNEQRRKRQRQDHLVH